MLILKVELCRQFNRIFEIVIVTHLYDVPQLKLKIRSFKLYVQKTSLLPCLSLLHSTLFSFQGSLFQLLLQPDLKIRLSPGLQIQQQICCLVGPSGLEPPTLRLSVVRSSQLSYGPISTAQGLVPSKLNNERAPCFARCCKRFRVCQPNV